MLLIYFWFVLIRSTSYDCAKGYTMQRTDHIIEYYNWLNQYYQLDSTPELHLGNPSGLNKWPSIQVQKYTEMKKKTFKLKTD